MNILFESQKFSRQEAWEHTEKAREHTGKNFSRKFPEIIPEIYFLTRQPENTKSMKNLFESQKFYFLTRQPENTKSMNILVESRELSRQEAREHKINGNFIGCPEIMIGERRAQRQPILQQVKRRKKNLQSLITFLIYFFLMDLLASENEKRG